MDDFDHLWIYFRGESIMFEIGNGTTRVDLEAYITKPENIDYHLKSEYGRWNGTSWLYDSETSPGVDGGYALSDFFNEPTPNGGIVNIGVYGNTSETSKSNLGTHISSLNENILPVYPNPTTGVIFVADEFIGNNYKVLSVTGVLVQKGNINSNQLDLLEIEKGIYFIEIINNKKMINVTKLIKE